jgi:hypothetical protein
LWVLIVVSEISFAHLPVFGRPAYLWSSLSFLEASKSSLASRPNIVNQSCATAVRISREIDVACQSCHANFDQALILNCPIQRHCLYPRLRSADVSAASSISCQTFFMYHL